ncbi:uncharacterized protein B0H18DRAFT_1123881 [Fomitopsis serialis]|uniref:uncharacterized protein n=1 Tax=Fomitopsis serialis TaxID=139415 RepID=UPI0020082584|nr:uncharacterized protein B0H18DRAFT_1123881 [Neoantrodia serialis]KAH9917044.1 hypothetical protein B0H18DRAFT_1123881 [Neoantrodia serialis]
MPKRAGKNERSHQKQRDAPSRPGRRAAASLADGNSDAGLPFPPNPWQPTPGLPTIEDTPEVTQQPSAQDQVEGPGQGPVADGPAQTDEQDDTRTGANTAENAVAVESAVQNADAPETNGETTSTPAPGRHQKNGQLASLGVEAITTQEPMPASPAVSSQRLVSETRKRRRVSEDVGNDGEPLVTNVRQDPGRQLTAARPPAMGYGTGCNIEDSGVSYADDEELRDEMAVDHEPANDDGIVIGHFDEDVQAMARSAARPGPSSDLGPARTGQRV